MKNIKVVISVLLLLVCSQGNAGDIGLGTLKGVKVYDFPDDKVTRIYFNNDATHQDEASCQGVGIITHSLHDEATTQKMLSIALSGYMSGKKVRAYSLASGSCEIYLISVQDTYF